MIVNKPTDKKKKKTSRYTVLCVIMGLIFGIIILRLLYIQVFNYEEYKANGFKVKHLGDYPLDLVDDPTLFGGKK